MTNLLVIMHSSSSRMRVINHNLVHS